MSILLLNETEIRNLVTLPEAISAMEEAFIAYSQKKAAVPPVVSLEVPEHQGEVHIKAAHLHSTREYVIKVAAGFWENRTRQLPVGSGLQMVFSAETGFPLAMLLDNGYLTDLRTAAAGAVAAKYMAPKSVQQVGVIGAGSQGRFQLEALACVRSFQRACIYDHRTENISRYIADMRTKIDAEIQPAYTVQEAVRGSQVVITATPSRKSLVIADWIEPGTHITALGSDGPDKQELDAAVLGRADRIIADSIDQCIQFGEIHHAVAQGVLSREQINGELGEVIQGRIPGRETDREITVCDLTGVGVQDAAIARLVFQRAVAGL
jgi:ornithine cyclodeaminase